MIKKQENFKILFESWRGFLAESLLLKPGENGWFLYSKLIADAYIAAPKFDVSAVNSFLALEPFVNKMFKRISSRTQIQFVENDPYKDDKEMKKSVKETGILKIWSGGTEHPLFTPEFNLKLRAVHDMMAHIQPHGHEGTDFTMEGEIKAYNNHLKTIPPEGAPALFTEVLGQASHFIHYGEFPEQKIATLKGFDYFNIGIVDGYRIINKELIKE